VESPLDRFVRAAWNKYAQPRGGEPAQAG
jgi:hypothetical protein